MTTTAQEFDLRGRVWKVAESSGVADPKQVAEEVLATLHTSELGEALAACLPDYVRLVLHGAGRPRVGPAGAPRSWKTEAAKAYAQKILRQRVDVAGDGTGWKFLAECNACDLEAVSAKRREQAEHLTAAAEWFEKIAALLGEHDAEEVKDLPESVLIALASNGEATS